MRTGVNWRCDAGWPLFFCCLLYEFLPYYSMYISSHFRVRGFFAFLDLSPRPPHKATVSRLVLGSGKQCKESRETRRWGRQGQHVARPKKIVDRSRAVAHSVTFQGADDQPVGKIPGGLLFMSAGVYSTASSPKSDFDH